MGKDKKTVGIRKYNRMPKCDKIRKNMFGG